MNGTMLEQRSTTKITRFQRLPATSQAAVNVRLRGSDFGTAAKITYLTVLLIMSVDRDEARADVYHSTGTALGLY